MTAPNSPAAKSSLALKCFEAIRGLLNRCNAPEYRRLVNVLGVLVSLACVLFVLHFIHTQWMQLRALQFSPRIVTALGGGVLIYLVAALGVACGWRQLMRAMSVRLSSHLAFVLVWRSQITKYLPSNLVQYGGRIFLAKMCGIRAPAVVTGGTLILEVALTAIACLVLSAPLLLGTLWLGLVWVAGLGAALGIVVATAVIYLRSLPTNARKARLPEFARGVIVAWFYYAAVILFLAVGLFIILQSVDPEHTKWTVFPRLLSATALAWIAGMAAVGSPAGLGVREAVLVVCLEAHHASAAVAIAVILHRVSTTLGDCAAFGLTFLHVPAEMRVRDDAPDGSGSSS